MPGVLELPQLLSTTTWPRWMSGAVGSMPSLTRSGRSFRAAFRAAPEPPPAATRRRFARGNGRSSAGSTGGFGKWRMLDSPTSSGQSRPSRACPQHRRAHARSRGDLHWRTTTPTDPAAAQARACASPIPHPAARPRRGERRPRLNKYRLALVLAGLGVLAAVSTVFGMMMAVAQDLPQLEAQNEFKSARNSTLVDDRGRNLATLTGARTGSCVRSSQISSNIKHAVIAIEDQRFYSTRASTTRESCARSLQDLRRQRAAQGGSTITQQFVKNALVAQKQPVRLPEAAGGRARLPARAQVVQGQDPHRVPEHRLLRGRRIRHRVGGARLLRHGTTPAASPSARRCSSRPRPRAGGA